MARDLPANEEALLLAAALGGEPGALERLLGACRRAIDSATRRVLARAGAASDDDLAEEVAARVAAALAAEDGAALRRFAGRSRLTTYVAVIARRLAQGALDERQGRGAVRLTDSSEVAALEPGPAEAAARDEEGRLLEQALARLAARDALVLRLFHQHGLRHREIGAALGVPVTHVGQILARARTKLKAELERRGVRA